MTKDDKNKTMMENVKDLDENGLKAFKLLSTVGSFAMKEYGVQATLDALAAVADPDYWAMIGVAVAEVMREDLKENIKQSAGAVVHAYENLQKRKTEDE